MTLFENGQLLRLEQLGRLINAFGVPLMLALITAVYFGWVPSPLYTTVLQNQRVLVEHAHDVRRVVDQRTQESAELARVMGRLADVLKMIDCGDIQDRTLRERCLQR